ncbi:MAG TPA: response regulator [Labilithrix sp.]|nr:response regulator [Labilithrix sp.]
MLTQSFDAGEGSHRPSKCGKLVVVDDEPVVLEAIELALTCAGHVVNVAASGRAAVELIRSGDVDLVLTDFEMGDMNGLQTMLEIKAAKPQLPVIIVTAFASAETEVELKRCGAVGIVKKPFLLDELYEAVERVLAHARVAR